MSSETISKLVIPKSLAPKFDPPKWRYDLLGLKNSESEADNIQ